MYYLCSWCFEIREWRMGGGGVMGDDNTAQTLCAAKAMLQTILHGLQHTQLFFFHSYR